MTATLRVDTITNSTATVSIATTYFQRRLVQRVYRRFHGGGNPEQGGHGLWNPGNEYRPIPGNSISITPTYDNSILVYTCMAPVGHRQNAHSITHWKFYAAGQEYARHSKSGQHMSFGHVHRYEVPSWGAGRAGMMGYQVRQYGDGTHSTHYNGRRWLDGADTSRSVPSWVMVEEYVTAP